VTAGVEGRGVAAAKAWIPDLTPGAAHALTRSKSHKKVITFIVALRYERDFKGLSTLIYTTVEAEVPGVLQIVTSD
jgi:hypothetical protein